VKSDLYVRILKTTSSKNGIRLIDQGHYIVSFKREKTKQQCFLTLKEIVPSSGTILTALRFPCRSYIVACCAKSSFAWQTW